METDTGVCGATSREVRTGDTDGKVHGLADIAGKVVELTGMVEKVAGLTELFWTELG